jgi:hypothetical protein
MTSYQISRNALACGFLQSRGLAPNVTYFVAERRKPSGPTTSKHSKVPGGSRRTATKSRSFGRKVSGIRLAPASAQRLIAAGAQPNHFQWAFMPAGKAQFAFGLWNAAGVTSWRW